MVAELIALDEAFFLDVLDCELFVVDFCTTLEVIVLAKHLNLFCLLMIKVISVFMVIALMSLEIVFLINLKKNLIFLKIFQNLTRMLLQN